MIALGTVFFRTTYFIDAAYIVAFSFLIYGMMGLTGPRTAVRGNKIAAVGMAIAVIATLLTPGVWSADRGSVDVPLAGSARCCRSALADAAIRSRGARSSRLTRGRDAAGASR